MKDKFMSEDNVAGALDALEKKDEVSSSSSNALLCDASIDGQHEAGVNICGFCGKKVSCSMTDKNDLIKSLDDYIEFAQGCRNFSNVAFYRKLKDYVENT